MSPTDHEKLRQQLILHEGRRRQPYTCTAGKLSIGVGYNISDRGLEPLRVALAREVTLDGLYKHGLTDAEIDRLLDADIAYVEDRVVRILPQYRKLDPVRQRVVIDFVFNLGPRARGFTKALAALKEAVASKGAERRSRYFAECAFHMMQSLWATQVGDGVGRRYDRAERLADMMRTGEDFVR